MQTYMEGQHEGHLAGLSEAQRRMLGLLDRKGWQWIGELAGAAGYDLPGAMVPYKGFAVEDSIARAGDELEQLAELGLVAKFCGSWDAWRATRPN
jgi:hypothetical protein